MFVFNQHTIAIQKQSRRRVRACCSKQTSPLLEFFHRELRLRQSLWIIYSLPKAVLEQGHNDVTTFAGPVANGLTSAADAIASLRFPSNLRLTPDQFALLCAENRDAVLELAAAASLWEV